MLYGLDSGGGKADYNIRATKRVVDPQNSRSLRTFFWLDLACVAASLWSVWLCLWGLAANYRFYVVRIICACVGGVVFLAKTTRWSFDSEPRLIVCLSVCSCVCMATKWSPCCNDCF